MSYLEYFKEEEGKDYVDMGIGFFTYRYSEVNKEMHICDLYISKEKRSIDAYVKVKAGVVGKGKELGARSITGNIFLNEANKEKFIKKILFFEKIGFKSEAIYNNTIIVIYKMEE